MSDEKLDREVYELSREAIGRLRNWLLRKLYSPLVVDVIKDRIIADIPAIHEDVDNFRHTVEIPSFFTRSGFAHKISFTGRDFDLVTYSDDGMYELARRAATDIEQRPEKEDIETSAFREVVMATTGAVLVTVFIAAIGALCGVVSATSDCLMYEKRPPQWCEDAGIGWGS